jgi:hypothetical protein
MRPPQPRTPAQAKQHGAALMVMLIIMVMGALTFLVSSLSKPGLQIERDKVTAAALAQAKEALIGFAVKVQISSSNSTNQPRPGDLPCPDNHTPGSALEGTPTTPCNTNALGRLPWKTLGLSDLRDSSGERLWYAVSTNFKNSTRIGTLNSDTPGTISVFSSDGMPLNDGGGNTGAVAVIIAPGEVLQRGSLQQDRSSAGNNTASNYLDIATVDGNTKDNANFTDGSTTFGFIQGRIKDGNGNVILNDQLLVITQDNIMQPLQKRVAAEVRLCLNEYALNNTGRYPWAVPLNDLTNYLDNTNQLFGRIPNDFTNTVADSVSMTNKWGIACNTHNNNIPSTWWNNWREMVFYGLADAYKPFNPPSTPTACPTCLSVNPPSATADKKFVIIVAGKKLTGQVRSNNADKGNLSNYLEAPNSGGAAAFTQGASSATFNDTVVFQ